MRSKVCRVRIGSFHWTLLVVFTALRKLVRGPAPGLAGEVAVARAGWSHPQWTGPPRPQHSDGPGLRSRFLQSKSRPETEALPRFIVCVLMLLGYCFRFTVSFPICFSDEV